MAESNPGSTVAPAPSSAAVPAQAASKNVSLYVGNLDGSVTENDLFTTFGQYGAVASVRVCRDLLTKQSLGYGYVNFTDPNSASAAMENLKFENLNGKPMRVAWSERDPTKRRTGVGNIFIRNLHVDIDERALHDTFATFGTVASSKVVTDKDGNSRGLAFVQYVDPKDAEKAIEKVNGKMIKDQTVYVAKYKTRKQRMEEYEAMKKNFTNVFVKDLPDEMTDEKFKEMFAPFGEITSFKLMKGREDKYIGFVAYAESAQAKAAVADMHEKDTDGRQLYVQRAQSKSERMAMLRRQYEQRKRAMQSKYQAGNLYVRNFPDDFTEENLREMFSKYGNITSIKIAKYEDGSSKGFGFVCFSSQEEATAAQIELHSKMVEGRPLHVSMHQTKEQRRAELARTRQQQMLQQQQQMMPGMMQGMMGGNRMMMRMPQQQQAYMMQQQPQQMRRAMPAGMMPPPGRAMLSQPQQPQQQPRGPPPQATAAAPPSAGGPPVPQANVPRPGLDEAQLKGLAPEQQKQMAGNFIYQAILPQYKEDAGKITGMLLEKPIEELVTSINTNQLQILVQQAHQVLEQAKAGAQAPPAAK
eukprot:TRINITY_DN6280_c0_g1_i1.p1 TRINITY_DN6280_c0_g1~~TRINITY_DN6280_c0_g1_i1.p1  ORF type:complete len:608 (+),score=219.06 TRINITY_DN6280_c0_g1_i1:73-1824(+)